MAKIYHVHLTDDERTTLLQMIHTGHHQSRKLTRARILLLADEGQPDQAIQAALHISRSTVERTRRRFVEGGLEAALNEVPRQGAPLKLDGKQEAYLVALACSPPPSGHTRWTLRLLADRLVGLGLVDTLSYETVRLRLKKTRRNRG